MVMGECINDDYFTQVIKMGKVWKKQKKRKKERETKREILEQQVIWRECQ